MGVPCARSLLEAIEGFIQKTNVIQLGRVNEADRLLAINCLVDNVMKEDILNIQLMNMPLMRSGKANNSTNCGKFYHRTESLIKVHPELLRKAMNNLAGLVAIKCAIEAKFMAEDLLARDNVDTTIMGNKNPSFIADQGTIFSMHGGTPMWILKSHVNSLRNRRNIKGGGSISILGVRAMNASLATSNHVVY